MKNINLLILSRVTSWQGGVVNFVELMKSHYSSYFIYESFNVGCRIKCSFINKLFTPIHDVIKLHRHIRFSTYDVIQLNPSLNLPSLIRDGVFMLCLRFNNCSNVFVVWHGWNSKIAQRLEHWPWNFVFRKVFGYATAMWVLSSTFMRQLMAMGIPASKIQQFTTMFDGRIFHNLER